MSARKPDNLRLDDLVSVSRRLGENIGYVQGGGGNTSLKVDAEKMFIKASGVALACVEDAGSFMAVNHRLLADEVLGCKDEADYGELLRACLIDDDSGRRPSIETGFHALLGPCVLHTHSIWANILTCSVEGMGLLPGLGFNAVWVPYATPGLALTKKVASQLSDHDASVIFLQNHGLIVAADTPAQARDLHERVNAEIRARLAVDPQFPWPQPPDGVKMHADHLLFPDQAVYSVNRELLESRSGIETTLAAQFLLQAVPACGLTLKFLDSAERDVLVNLESEKYRQEVAKT